MQAFVRQRMGKALQDKESTSDLVQSSIREMLRHESVDPGSIKALFFAIAKNKICDRLRFWGSEKRNAKKETHRLVDLMSAGPEENSPDDLEAMEQHQLLSQAMQRLSADSREIIQRLRIAEEPVAQVARSLGLSEKAVRHRLYRALLRLGKELGHHE